MTDDLVRLVTHDDHARGCEGRLYACSCGYETRIEAAIREAAARIEALEAESRKLREAAAPFVDIGPQKGAWGVVSKKLNDMAPLTLTVTKGQFKSLWAALTDPRHD